LINPIVSGKCGRPDRPHKPLNEVDRQSPVREIRTPGLKRRELKTDQQGAAPVLDPYKKAHQLRTGPGGLPGRPFWISNIGIPVLSHCLVDGLVDRFEGLREIRGGQASHFDKFDHDLFAGPQNMLFQISFFHGVRLSLCHSGKNAMPRASRFIPNR
jgi:hypothetical protein